MRKVYLDHSATTPVRPEVARIVLEYMTDKFGNPSSVHSFGRETRAALDKARQQVADSVGGRPEEIIFTSGGTEADNMAIIGIAQAYTKKGKHIITSAIEHHAVLDTCQKLEKQGFSLTVLPVDKEGLIDPQEVKKAIKEDTILITIMHANNEIGTIQPIKEIGEIAREHGVFFHTDAVQSLGKIPIDVNEMAVDLLTGSGHKIYGPKGVGFLFIRKGIRLSPLVTGGSQERKKRPGTENLPGIVGMGLAAQLAVEEMEREMSRQEMLRDKLIEGLKVRITDARLNGHLTKRVASNVNISFEYVEGESLLLSLDMKGIAASSGSACTSGSLDPSHVLLALGLSHETAHGSVRMTLGKGTSEEDIDYVLEEFPSIVERLRMMSPLYSSVDQKNSI